MAAANTTAKTINSTTATYPEVHTGVTDGSWNSCQMDAGFWWSGEKWIAGLLLYYQTPVPCPEHEAWIYLQNLPPGPGTEIGETTRWKRFTCDESTNCGTYTNGLQVIIEAQNDSQKSGCDVSGSLQWNAGTQKWEAKAISYNGAPPPCEIHPAGKHSQNIRIPNRPGTSAWETVEWKKFECITGCENYPAMLQCPVSTESNEYISGSLVYTSHWGWLRLILTYNGAPEPCPTHPIFGYFWELGIPGTPGAELEIRNTQYWSVLDGCNNGLTPIFQQKNDSTKGNCDVSGSLQWNQGRMKWEAKVIYYNTTPTPCSGHSAEVHARTVPIPSRNGAYSWETVEWKFLNCQCIGN